MEQVKQLDPDQPAHIIAVKIVNEATAPSWYPANNFSSGVVLHRLLSNALKSRDILVSGAGGGELNLWNGRYIVSDLQAGLAVFREELEKVGLLHVCNIAWWDEREQIWRRSFPDTDGVDARFCSNETMEAVMQQMQRAIERMNKEIEEGGKHPTG
jgi:hypothetical protein